jgi:hypothetical protein
LKKENYNADRENLWDAEAAEVLTTQIWIQNLRGKSGGDYFDLDSSVTSVEQLAATMAGAMTIPIKARAIKKSCII